MPIKIATDVPDPPLLTPEAHEEIKKDAEDWRRKFKAQTEDMEWITSEDWNRRVR